MGKPSPPSAPNPQQTAQAQTQSNIQTAITDAQLARINQTTPYGSSTYNITGYTPGPYGTQIPQYSQSTTLSPAEQQLFNINTQGQIGQGNIALGMQNQVANAFSHPIDTSSLPGLKSQINPQDTAAQVQAAENAAYGQQAQYLDPRFKQQQEAQESQDANMGITHGSQAWNTDEQNLNLSRNQAYQSAQNAAVLAGQQEQNTLYQQAAQQAQLQNQANQLGLQNIFALTNEPLNAYSALMSGAQVQQPNFQPYSSPTVQPTDIAGITQNAFNDQMQAYQAQQAANPLNSIFGLGGELGAAWIMSDRRLKNDIGTIGHTHGGIPIHLFSFKATPADLRVGVMADEAKRIAPHAVHRGPHGFDMVDYRSIH